MTDVTNPLSDIEEALTKEELEITGVSGQQLSFDIDNISYYPSVDQSIAAEAIGAYFQDSSEPWSHLRVRGTLKLMGREPYLCSLDIDSVNEKNRERYERSNLRPTSLQPRMLVVDSAVSREMNIGDGSSGVPSISFYTGPDYNGGKWSVHCHRKSRRV